jgi:hypothetical protein
MVGPRTGQQSWMRYTSAPSSRQFLFFILFTTAGNRAQAAQQVYDGWFCWCALCTHVGGHCDAGGPATASQGKNATTVVRSPMQP